MSRKADIGLVGLGVMGRNLVLNLNDHGFTVVVFNRTTARVDEFLAGEARETSVVGARSLRELTGLLARPRLVMLMVPAGRPVDEVIGELAPLLDPGDVIIDGGNSHYLDSARRVGELEARGLLFVGCGVSGGEEGARRGPSLMPGGSSAAWPVVRETLQSIAARVSDGTPCCDWVGSGGAGHFVKMVHNGVEYGDMQLIAEAYDLMKRGAGLDNETMSGVFAEWNGGRLDSYLIAITAEILALRDPSGTARVDEILDAAGQKGTGRWVVEAAAEQGVPLCLIGEALFARFLSALHEERQQASRILGGGAAGFDGDRKAFVADIHDALYAAKIVSYAQGYMLLREASARHGWDLDPGGIALMWREGCIIRAAFLDRIKEAFDREPGLGNLLLAPYFSREMEGAQAGWRRVVAAGAALGIPLPAMSSALAFFDGYRSGRLPANLIQAQRDFFGAHTYERVDRPRGEFFHADWDTGTETKA